MPMTLTPEAAAKLATLRATLAQLRLTPDQAHALLLAEDVAEDVALAGDDITIVLDSWAEGGYDAWSDMLAEVHGFLTDRG